MKNIRRVPIICAAVILLLLSVQAYIGYAAQVIENMSASVGVNAVFSISVNPITLDFLTVNPGTTTAAKDLTLSCSTNDNMPWMLQLSDTAELTSATFTIPNANFNWWGWSEGTGTWNPGTAKMSVTPFTFYNAGLGEYITSTPVITHLTFNVDVPANQAMGTYTTTLVITMTE